MGLDKRPEKPVDATALRAAIDGARALASRLRKSKPTPQAQMLAAMAATGRPFHGGTVPRAEVRRRRAVNKRARTRRAAR